MFKCAKNKMSYPIIIPSFDSEVNDLVVGPFESQWLVNEAAWELSNPMADNLRQLVEDGKIEIVELERRPRPFTMPTITQPEVRNEDHEMLMQVVFQTDRQMVADIVNTEAVMMDTPDMKNDLQYLKKRHLPVLRAVLQAYDINKDVDFPDAANRKKLVGRRIKQLETM